MCVSLYGSKEAFHYSHVSFYFFEYKSYTCSCSFHIHSKVSARLIFPLLLNVGTIMLCTANASVSSISVDAHHKYKFKYIYTLKIFWPKLICVQMFPHPLSLLTGVLWHTLNQHIYCNNIIGGTPPCFRQVVRCTLVSCDKNMAVIICCYH